MPRVRTSTKGRSRDMKSSLSAGTASKCEAARHRKRRGVTAVVSRLSPSATRHKKKGNRFLPGGRQVPWKPDGGLHGRQRLHRGQQLTIRSRQLVEDRKVVVTAQRQV